MTKHPVDAFRPLYAHRILWYRFDDSQITVQRVRVQR
jgi:hypothetical protein